MKSKEIPVFNLATIKNCPPAKVSLKEQFEKNIISVRSKYSRPIRQAALSQERSLCP